LLNLKPKKTMKAYLTYALNKEGDLVHIDGVPNGNECECFCPHCKSELCAKNEGVYKVHHFAHLNGADCVGAIESALHKMAKDVMKETLCIQLPDRFDGSRGELLKLDRVEVEFYDKETNLRPDCVGYYGDKFIWIEFKRAHAVDTKKKGKIISAKIDCVELDINECELNPDAVRKFITEETRNRIWIRDTNNDSTRKYSPNSNNSNGNFDYDCNYYYDDYDYYTQWRSYAKDENGTLVNLNNDEVNMNEHKYYCLACGRELTIDVNRHGKYYFVPLESKVLCDADLYLREAAKEIIWHKFTTSDKFEIMVPQHISCKKKDTCDLYDSERCQKREKIKYDLKTKGYNECLKNVKLQDAEYKCDLIIKHAENEKNDIIINIETEDYHVVIDRNDYRIINIDVEDINLEDLQKFPIGYEQTSQIEDEQIGYEQISPIRYEPTKFLNFKKETKNISTIESKMYRFQLFSSGKSRADEVSCQNLEKRNGKTVLEYLFVHGINSIQEARRYSLLKCHEQGRKACFCDICLHFIYEKKICNRYKTKGTPRFPLKVLPVDCPHFTLNRNIKNQFVYNSSNIQVIENIVK